MKGTAEAVVSRIAVRAAFMSRVLGALSGFLLCFALFAVVFEEYTGALINLLLSLSLWRFAQLVPDRVNKEYRMQICRLHHDDEHGFD